MSANILSTCYFAVFQDHTELYCPLYYIVTDASYSVSMSNFYVLKPLMLGSGPRALELSGWQSVGLFLALLDSHCRGIGMAL
jgi:hypothetical protein